MIKKFFATAMTFTVYAAALTPAFSGTHKVTVKAGANQTIGYFWLYDKSNCGPLPSGKASVKTEPHNGSVKIARHVETIKEGKCKGTKVTGWKFIYRGNGKSDIVKIRIRGARYIDGTGNNTWIETYKINR